MKWLDAHHHLWHLDKIHYPWLMAKGERRFFGQPDPIRKNYLLQDFALDHQDLIVKSVHIQVGASPEDALKETLWLAECSKTSKGDFPAKAVVAIDMLSDNVLQQIEVHKAFNITQGARHIIGKNAEENKKLPRFEPTKWLSSLKLLAESELSFDLQLTADQYQQVFDVLVKVPKLKVVICHLASPWDQSDDGFKHWQYHMKLFSQLPNCYIKLSGFSMFNHGMLKDRFMQYCHEAINIFSPKRCMFGSNFPVDKLYIDYPTLLNLWHEITKSYSACEAQHLQYQTAANFYDLV